MTSLAPINVPLPIPPPPSIPSSLGFLPWHSPTTSPFINFHKFVLRVRAVLYSWIMTDWVPGIGFKSCVMCKPIGRTVRLQFMHQRSERSKRIQYCKLGGRVLKNFGAPLATKFCIQNEVVTKREVGGRGPAQVRTFKKVSMFANFMAIGIGSGPVLPKRIRLRIQENQSNANQCRSDLEHLQRLKNSYQFKIIILVVLFNINFSRKKRR